MFEASSLIDQIIDGKFRILSLQGLGGMGTVYKAEQIGLDRLVALKLMHANLLTDGESQSRFAREAHALSLLNHKNIGIFYSYGFWQEHIPYIAMEMIEGTSLHELLETEGKLPWRRSLNICLQACRGLAHSHASGVVHRDIKPNNIILLQDKQEEDSLKLVDFGLAKVLATGQEVQKLTQTGALVGSVHYMSPELCSGLAPDQRADIYSLGCVLYKCLTGITPHDADNPIGILHKHVNEKPRSPSITGNLKLPAGLDDLVMKMLAKDRSKRYQSMNELENDLVLVLDNRGLECQASQEKAGKEHSKSANNSKRNKSSVFVISGFFLLILSGSILTYFYLNSPAGIVQQLKQKLAAPHSEANYKDIIKTYSKLESLNGFSGADFYSLRSQIYEYAKVISPIEAARLCNDFAGSDKEHRLQWACKGLHLLAAATGRKFTQVKLLQTLSDYCLQSQRKIPLEVSELTTLSKQLNSTALEDKLPFMLMHASVLREHDTNTELLSNLCMIAAAYTYKRETAKARKYYEEAYKLCSRLQSPNQSLLFVRNNECQALRSIGAAEESERVLMEAYLLVQKTPSVLAEEQVIFARRALECGELLIAKESAEHLLELARQKMRIAEATFKGSKFLFGSIMASSKKELEKEMSNIASQTAALADVLAHVYYEQADFKKLKNLKNECASENTLWIQARNSSAYRSYLLTEMKQVSADFQLDERQEKMVREIIEENRLNKIDSTFAKDLSQSYKNYLKQKSNMFAKIQTDHN